MKKALTILLAILTALALVCTVSVLAYRNHSDGSPLIRTLTASEDPDADMLININTADAALLSTLPGIGSTLAQRIVEYRDANGPFRSVAGLLAVAGIGEGKLEAILDLITTGGTA